MHLRTRTEGTLFIRQKTGNFAHFGTVLRIMETHLYKMLRRRSLDKDTPIKNIFATKELQEDSVCSILELTARDGKKYKTKLYN